MNIDHTLTALEIGLYLGATAILTILWASAYHMVCHAIETHRRLRHRHDSTAAVDELRATAEQFAQDQAPTQTEAMLDAIRELDAACCERWWTTLNTDHDPTCPNQTRKENS